jgi:hypothetical protein
MVSGQFTSEAILDRIPEKLNPQNNGFAKNQIRPGTVTNARATATDATRSSKNPTRTVTDATHTVTDFRQNG